MEKIIHKDKINDNLEWNESYYFVFYDKTQNIGGMSRIGFKPNKEEAMTFFFLFFPDGSAAGYHQTIKMKEFTNQLKVKKMSHEWQNSGNWHYKFSGTMIFVENSLDLPNVRDNPKLISKSEKVKLDLSYKPINDVYEYSEYMTEESLEIGKKSGDKHWEQIGIVNGNIKVGEMIYTIKNTMSQRDHTYGVRDWTGVGNWIYYVIWFDENLAINPAAIITNDGRISSGGFLFKDGENIPLRQIIIKNQSFEGDGMLPISSKLEIVDDLGVIHQLKGVVGSIIPIPFEDESGNISVLVQSFAHFELDGIKGGYGTFETLRRSKKE